MLKDHWPRYLNISEARELLSRMGLVVTRRQMQRAAEKDAAGRRKLPFFIDPIDKKLKIEQGDLIRAYRKLQAEATITCGNDVIMVLYTEFIEAIFYVRYPKAGK